MAANSQIVNTPGNLQEITAYIGTDAVVVGNGEYLPIIHNGKGKISIVTTDLSLKQVLVVPDIKKNLLSVSQLTSDLPCSVNFTGNGFVVKDLMMKRILSSGSKENGLYVLKDASIVANFSNRSRTVNEDIWHKRFGHPQIRITRFLNKSGSISFSKK
ncbi:hypothetical protein CFOL_v3_23103 [Cephalotus follicularis]|uniref:Retrovirus-related Pol polyprotein from transposon TNT 1-94-like beta-barrel domain-containing protein n=1 Tax=Cephalotus follicularis TaxID=3775 RepID=A0A1Q3CHE8_CEPFO|nr:hypothetical protein CFOL_v3_23103 [Cephalotus follicularis]